jgi:hypothetical protein
VFWIKKTISAVLRVVTVFAINCQVSEKPKNGPETNHVTIRNPVTMNAQ